MSTTPPVPTPTPAPAGPLYLSFTDPVQQPIADHFLNLCAAAVLNRTPSLTVFLSTIGGNIDIGVNLYNHLLAYPFTITTHATGNVDSVGITIFLGGKERLAAPSARFLFHGATQPVVAGLIELPFTRSVLASMEGQGRRLAAVVAARTKISLKEAENLYNSGTPIVMYADEALEKGIVHRIEEPRIPVGARYFRLEVPSAPAKP